MLYKRFGTISIVILLFSAILYGQDNELVLNPWNGDAATYVNAQIVADTLATGGLLPNRVYVLLRDQYYFDNAIVNIPAGETLRIKAEAGTGKKPVIYLDESGVAPNPTRPPGNFIVLNGGSIELKDICVVGYLEDFPDRVSTVQGGLIQVGALGSTIIIDGCILSNINGQHIRTNFTTRKIQVTNSVFANMGALTTSNLGAGKGIDLREVAHDTVIFVNNTFVNYQDRIIRHLDLGAAGSNPGAIKYLKFDHNTIINGMAFHGLLSLGSMGDQAIITNNLFYDAFAMGEDSSDATRTAEWLNTGETYPTGKNRMTWIFSVPNTTTEWTVANNYFTVSPPGHTYLNDNHFGFGPFNVGEPLSYHINSRLGADSVNAFFNDDALVLNNKPNLMVNEMMWYEDPAGGGRVKSQTNFVVSRDDYDRRKVEYFRDTLDAAYSVSSPEYTGAAGYPAGDLNWFPDKKAMWEQGVVPFSINVDGFRDDFFSSLTGPADGYLQLRHFVNSNNGRPVDDNDLSAKIWTAWNSDWFYLYEEVKDDTLNGSSPNVWEEDEIELKFDPQPTDSTQAGTSIWDTRLTILSLADGAAQQDSLNNLAAANKQFVRKIVPGGYVQELAIKWSAIRSSNGETITPVAGTQIGIAINQHDNDAGHRQATVMWAAVLLDNAYQTPKYLGTVTLLDGNKLGWDPTNKMTGVNNPLPYDGSDEPLGVEVISGLPKDFSLSQNYPNPFNPTTIIQYALPKESAVEISVYNLLGQKISELVNEVKQAGYHKAAFNGVSLPSGIYFYRIKAGSFVETKKFTLIK